MGIVDGLAQLIDKSLDLISHGVAQQEQVRFLAALLGLVASLVTIVAGIYALHRWWRRRPPRPRDLEATRRARIHCENGETQLRAGQLNAAVATFSIAAELHPRSVRALKGRGLARLGLGEPDAARADFRAWVGITPHQAEPYLHRAMASRALGDMSEAIQDCRQALLLSPNHGPARRMLGELEATQPKQQPQTARRVGNR